MLEMIALVTYYIINATGSMNTSATNITSATGFFNFTNVGTNGLVGMIFIFVPVIIIFGILLFKTDIAIAGMIASFVGSGISLLIAQIATGTNLVSFYGGVLLLFISLALISTAALLLKGISRPYG